MTITRGQALETVAASPSLLRKLNLTLVLKTIQDRGPVSRTRLATLTGLSKPTVNLAVEFLLVNEYIEETDTDFEGQGPKRPGPRAKLLTFRANRGYLLGIDTGADNTVANLADLSGTVIAVARIGHPDPPQRDDVLAAIRSTATHVLDQADLRREQVHAITIGTPGVVDPISKTISLAPQIDGWDGLNLAAELRDIAECAIAVENESHLSLLAEQWKGAAQDVGNVVFVQVGIGIGGALLLEGRIYRGSTGAAGEIAYMPVESDEQIPSGTRSGSFEWFAGGHAYRRHGAVAARGAQGARLRELAGGDPEAVTALIVFAAAAEGDPAAVEVSMMLLERLGRGIASVATTVNPDLVLIGGGIANAGSSVLTPIQAIIDELTPHPPRVELSGLGSDGTVIGAVCRAREIADHATFSFAIEPQ